MIGHDRTLHVTNICSETVYTYVSIPMPTHVASMRITHLNRGYFKTVLGKRQMIAPVKFKESIPTSKISGNRHASHKSQLSFLSWISLKGNVEVKSCQLKDKLVKIDGLLQGSLHYQHENQPIGLYSVYPTKMGNEMFPGLYYSRQIHPKFFSSQGLSWDRQHGVAYNIVMSYAQILGGSW